MATRVRVILGVTTTWVIVAIVWASQSVLGANLQGDGMPAGEALRTSLIQTLPWIPVSLAIIGVTNRFPVTRRTWKTSLPAHLLAFPLLLFIENALVVLAFWISSGAFGDMSSLLASARFWSLMRIHVAAVVYIAIAGLTQGIAYYRRSRDRELQLATTQAQLSRARLDALTAQIRPHFLFNTLHTIGHLWRSGRADEADAMLDHLGVLFQRVQECTERPLISLDEELRTVHAYLAIEAARFSDRLHVETNVSDDTRDCGVPPLLLQPIVENAVRHGITASSAAGRIAVKSRLANGRVHLDVEDDGPGLDLAPAGHGTGTGLRNARERLHHLFGSDCRLDIISDGTGTRVHIEIPVVRAGAQTDGTSPSEEANA